MADPPPGERSYSRAFENLVTGEQDVVGLLAYALFKQAIREEAGRGNAPTGDTRNPSPTVVQVYRQSAQRQLEEFVALNIEEARPELQRSAMLDAVETARLDLRGHIDRRTGTGAALLTNIIAWVITLAITVLILSMAGRPDPGQTLADLAGTLGRDKAIAPADPATIASDKGKAADAAKATPAPQPGAGGAADAITEQPPR
jgi:hypothetical protein